MIEVKRIEHAAITSYGKQIPAWYEVRYYHKPIFESRKEIAHYCSKDDTLRVRSEYIAHDRKKSTYENALNGRYSDAYKYLFAMLGVDATSRINEYMYA